MSPVPAYPETFTVPPKQQPELGKPGQLSQEQLREFFDKGFIVVKDIIDLDLLERLRKEWEAEANELIEGLFKAGKIRNKHEDKDFFTRLIEVNKEYPGTELVLGKKF